MLVGFLVGGVSILVWVGFSLGVLWFVFLKITGLGSPVLIFSFGWAGFAGFSVGVVTVGFQLDTFR